MSNELILTINSAIMIPDQVMARAVGNETVILDLASGTYFGLDPVGARVWTLIGEGKSLAQACDVMVAELDVTRDVLEQDVLDLARDLVEKKLISLG